MEEHSVRTIESHEADEIASWHLLQLAEQGRGYWPIAQYFVSALLSSGYDRLGDAFGELKQVVEEIQYLLDHPINIWPGLMPGEMLPKSIATHDRLNEMLAQANTPPPANTIDVTLIMSLEVGGLLACNQQGGLGHIKHEFYTNLSNPDMLNTGDILRVELDNFDLIDGSEVHSLLN